MAFRFPRVNVHVLTVFLIVGVPLFVIGAFIAIGTGQAQLRQTYGQQLAAQAEHTAGALDAYIYRRIIDASVIARVPDVRAAAAAGNALAFNSAGAAQLTAGWIRPPAAVLRAEPGPIERASTFFKEIATADPLFREILATDSFGRVVASFTMRSAAYVADEPWWKDARGDGVHGRITAGDIVWDKRARAYSLDIAAPISASMDDTVSGVLHVIIDAREMLAMIADVQPGTAGNSFLLRPDGSLVYSRWPGRTASTFFAADLVVEKLRALRDTTQPARLYLAARGDDGTAQMVGLARSQLGLSYPNLSWLVAVSQPDSELFAPLRSTGSNLLLVLALTAVGVLGFTLWDSRRLAAQPEMMEADLHLVRHPRVHRIDEDYPEEEPSEQESGNRLSSPI